MHCNRSVSGREGSDDFLTEGVRRVSENLGGDAAKMGAYVLN
jgi:hypothetical protein